VETLRDQEVTRSDDEWLNNVDFIKTGID
jgi:hypothetical protein